LNKDRQVKRDEKYLNVKGYVFLSSYWARGWSNQHKT